MYHVVTTIYHVVTTMYHVVTTIYHVVTTMCHVVTTIYHVVTTIYHVVTTMYHVVTTMYHVVTTNYKCKFYSQLYRASVTLSSSVPVNLRQEGVPDGVTHAADAETARLGRTMGRLGSVTERLGEEGEGGRQVEGRKGLLALSLTGI